MTTETLIETDESSALSRSTEDFYASPFDTIIREERQLSCFVQQYEAKNRMLQIKLVRRCELDPA